MGRLTAASAILFVAGLQVPVVAWTAATQENGTVVMSSAGEIEATSADSAVIRPTGLERFRVSARSETIPVPMNQLHDWIVHVETPAGQVVEDAQIRVTGGMPVHRHGFPTEPRVTRYLGGGDYLLQGMKFSMAGEWLIRLDISAQGTSDAFKIYLELP